MREAELQEELRAKSSSGDASYVVQFFFDAGKLSVFCNCSAGEFGKICKHKLSFLAGEKELLSSDDQAEALIKVQEWCSMSELKMLLASFRAAEDQVATAQATLAAAKKRIEIAMKHGA